MANLNTISTKSKKEYDAMGHRTAKHVYNGSGNLERSTYYILDAQGNTMVVYEREVNQTNQTVTFTLEEKHIFGSARIGVLNDSLPMLGSQNTTYNQTIWNHIVGKRTYELANHLNNVLSVISDKVLPHSSNGTAVDYYLADIIQSTDYSGFGVQLSGRNFVKSGAKEFAFGFQGQLEDDELKGDGNSLNYEFRMHDPRLGRFFAIDPLTKKYPSNSPYAFSENRVIDGVELEGLEFGIIIVVEARASALLSVSTATDFIIYFDGVFNNDKPCVKLIHAKTTGSGYGTLGANIGWHVGLWLGDDDAIAGEGVTFGVDVHVVAGLSLGVGISKNSNSLYGWETLPSGIAVTLGQGWGLSADIYGESSETTTEPVTLFYWEDIGKLVKSFVASPSNKNTKALRKSLSENGIALSQKNMNHVQKTMKAVNHEKKKTVKSKKKQENRSRRENKKKEKESNGRYRDKF